MHSRRVPFPSATHANERAGIEQDQEIDTAAERRVVVLFGRAGGAPSTPYHAERSDPRDTDKKRFDAFICGLYDVFMRGGIAEVRKLAREPTSTFRAAIHAFEADVHAARSALCSSRRRSEVDMFLSVLGSLERAQRRGGLNEALAEFSRIGRRITQTGSSANPRNNTPH